ELQRGRGADAGKLVRVVGGEGRGPAIAGDRSDRRLEIVLACPQIADARDPQWSGAGDDLFRPVFDESNAIVSHGRGNPIVIEPAVVIPKHAEHAAGGG